MAANDEITAEKAEMQDHMTGMTMAVEVVLDAITASAIPEKMARLAMQVYSAYVDVGFGPDMAEALTLNAVNALPKLKTGD